MFLCDWSENAKLFIGCHCKLFWHYLRKWLDNNLEIKKNKKQNKQKTKAKKKQYPDYIYICKKRNKRELWEKEDVKKHIFAAVFYYALAITLLILVLTVLVTLQYHRTIYHYFY